MVGQFDYLNRLRKERRIVSLYLMSGIRFMGRVMSFDREGLLLDTKHGELLFAQQQISTIGPELPKARSMRTATNAAPGRAHERDHVREHPPAPRFERSEARPLRNIDAPLREPLHDLPHATPRPAHTVQITRKKTRGYTRDTAE